MTLIWLADGGSPIGPDTSRSIDTVGAVNRWFPVRRRFVNDRSPIWAHASRSIDSIDARGSVGLLGERERTKRNHDGDRYVFHFNDTVPQFNQPAVRCRIEPLRNIFCGSHLIRHRYHAPSSTCDD